METTDTTKLAGADVATADFKAGPVTVVEKQARPILVVQSQIAVFDTAMFEHMQRLAVMIATSNLVPEHLNYRVKIAGTRDEYRELTPKEAISNCFLVVNQAHKWGMDPFSLAQGVFVTKGKVGYEGKVIATVVNSHPQMADRLKYRFEGVFANGQRKVIVTGRLKGENEDRTVEGTVKDWATDNGGWKQATSADQMLTYRGAREWGRRHLPEALMGVYADEEIEAIDSELGGRQPARPATHAGEAEPAAPASRTAGLAADLAKRAGTAAAEDVTIVDQPDPKLKEGEKLDQGTGEITDTRPAPTLETLHRAIEGATTQADLQPILAQMTALPASPERAELMQFWNKRVMALKGPQEAEDPAAPPPAREPSPGPDPWAEPLKKALAEIAEAKSSDQLDTIMDRQNSVKWPAKLKKQVMTAYTDAREKLA